MAEGSCSFEDALSRMILDGTVSREEGLAHVDSVTDLLWRLQNASAISRVTPKIAESDEPEYTDFSVDIIPEGFVPQRGAGSAGFPSLLSS